MGKQQETDVVLFTGDQAASAETEDDLQRAIFQLTITSEAYYKRISSEKAKTISFKEKKVVKNEIVLYENI